MMNFIYKLTFCKLFILVLAICLLIGLAGVWLVRRNQWMLAPKDNDTAAFTHAFVGVLYAVALGLMVVSVQSTYTEVETVVMNEACFAGDLYVDAHGLDTGVRKIITNLTREYVNSVIKVEWPAIQKSGSIKKDTATINETQKIIDELAIAVIDYTPSNEKQMIVYAEVLNEMNDLLDQRRERLHLGRDGVGKPTWLVVVIGAFITIGMAWFYNTKSVFAHYSLVTSMSLMFGLMIILILAMDCPLRGEDFSVEVDPFKNVKKQMNDFDEKILQNSNLAFFPGPLKFL